MCISGFLIFTTGGKIRKTAGRTDAHTVHCI